MGTLDGGPSSGGVLDGHSVSPDFVTVCEGLCVGGVGAAGAVGAAVIVLFFA